MATIVCADCGATRTQCPSNTRYCWLCRLIRDMDYWVSHTKRCACGAIFAPLRRTDHRCSKCAPGLRHKHGRCVMSNGEWHEGHFLDGRLPVCDACVRDPKLRPRLWKALLRGQADRQKTHNHKEAPC